jgi:uncharacterized protein (DUF1778 family)
MGKTITLRVDDSTYQQLKSAAEAERRSLSNFIENAALSYMENSRWISDKEMKNILEDSELVNNLQKSLEDIRKGQYRILE